jgi:hypothetical protein
VRVEVAVEDQNVLVTLTRTHFQSLGVEADDVIWVSAARGAPRVQLAPPTSATTPQPAALSSLDVPAEVLISG